MIYSPVQMSVPGLGLVVWVIDRHRMTCRGSPMGPEYSPGKPAPRDGKKRKRSIENVRENFRYLPEMAGNWTKPYDEIDCPALIFPATKAF